MTDDIAGALRALDEAHAHLVEDEAHAACDALLAAWRAVRAPEIAVLCETLTERATLQGQARPQAKTAMLRLAAWTKDFAQRRALDLGPLLAEFEASVVEEQTRFVFPRADALATSKDDPRVATAMLRVLPRFATSEAWKKCFLRAVRALEASGDTRAIGPLEAALARIYRGDPRFHQAERALNALRDLPAATLPPELTDSVGAVRRALAERPLSFVAPVIGKAPVAPSDPNALLAAVYADPDDDARRLVLADALTERDDPRGEFIVLQFDRASGRTSTKALARERALLKENLRDWLGPLTTVLTLKDVVFERGFLSAGRVSVRQTSLALVIDDDRWSTVHTLAFDKASAIGPTMRSLADVGPIDTRALRQLARTGHPKIRRLVVAWEPGPTSDAAFEAFAKCAMPALTILGLRPLGVEHGRVERVAWLRNAVWVESLRELQVPLHPQAHEWVSEFSRMPLLERIFFTGPVRFTLNRVPNGVALDVHLPALPAAADPSFYVSDVIRALEFFHAATLSRVAVQPAAWTLSPRAQDQLRRALAKFGGAEIVLPFPLVALH